MEGCEHLPHLPPDHGVGDDYDGRQDDDSNDDYEGHHDGDDGQYWDDTGDEEDDSCGKTETPLPPPS